MSSAAMSSTADTDPVIYALQKAMRLRFREGGVESSLKIGVYAHKKNL